MIGANRRYIISWKYKHFHYCTANSLIYIKCFKYFHGILLVRLDTSRHNSVSLYNNRHLVDKKTHCINGLSLAYTGNKTFFWHKFLFPFPGSVFTLAAETWRIWMNCSAVMETATMSSEVSVDFSTVKPSSYERLRVYGDENQRVLWMTISVIG